VIVPPRFREPSSQIRQIGSPPFWSTHTSHCHRAGLGGSRSCERCILSGVKGGSTADVCGIWIIRCISRPTSFVGVINDPRYTNSLTTSKCLLPIATLCPTSRIVLSFRAAIIYFVFCSFIFNPTLAASPSNAKYAFRTAD
jgi:hypothetical protein